MARKNVKNQKHKSQVHNNSTNKKSAMNKMEPRDYVNAFNKLALRHYETKNFEKALEVLNKKCKHLDNELATVRSPITPLKLPLLIDTLTMQMKTSLEKAEVLKKLGKINNAMGLYNMAGSKIQAFLEYNHENLKKDMYKDIKDEITAILIIQRYECAKIHIKDRNFKLAEETLSPCLTVFEKNPNVFKKMKKIDFLHKSFDMMELWSKIAVILPKCYYENETRAKKGHPDVKRNIGLSANSAMVCVIVAQAFARCD